MRFETILRLPLAVVVAMGVMLSAQSAAAQPAAASAPVALPETRPTPIQKKPIGTKPVATTKPTIAAPTPARPAAAGVGFAVQLGAFGSAAEANKLRDRVRAAGFSAFVQEVRTDQGTLSRVRIGPVLNRADADQLKAQVLAKLGLSGIVQSHP